MITVRVHLGRLEARGARPEDHDQLITLRDLWEERAAILEYEAGFTRVEAEGWASQYAISSHVAHKIVFVRVSPDKD